MAGASDSAHGVALNGKGESSAPVGQGATLAGESATEVFKRLTERGETRADDRVTEAAMEDRKKAGYF